MKPAQVNYPHEFVLVILWLCLKIQALGSHAQPVMMYQPQSPGIHAFPHSLINNIEGSEPLTAI